MPDEIDDFGDPATVAAAKKAMGDLLARLSEEGAIAEKLTWTPANGKLGQSTPSAIPLKLTPNERRLWDFESALAQYLGHAWLNEQQGRARPKLTPGHKDLLRRIVAEEPIEYIRDEQTERRDTYIYLELCKGTPPLMIRGVVNATKGWTRLGGREAVRQAGIRYAKRHKLPPPTPRKPGRRKGI